MPASQFLPRPPNHTGPLDIQEASFCPKTTADWLAHNGLKGAVFFKKIISFYAAKTITLTGCFDVPIGIYSAPSRCFLSPFTIYELSYRTLYVKIAHVPGRAGGMRAYI